MRPRRTCRLPRSPLRVHHCRVLCPAGRHRYRYRSTSLSAFDAALRDAGVANFNLVRLSSVIPPDTEVDTTGATPIPEGGWGDRLYCVYAEQHADLPGVEAWAGIGWVQRLDGQGGLFVEHEGPTEAFLTTAIESSLADLVAGRPGGVRRGAHVHQRHHLRRQAGVRVRRRGVRDRRTWRGAR